jgi:peptidoglycan/xylan/chitin deacetylase (PgdA/CDA1 family)
MARPRLRALSGVPRAVILVYHMVADELVDPYGTVVSPDRFADQMDVIASAFRPVGLVDLVSGLRDGQCPPGAVTVTFDDGYANNLETALPILDRYAVPSTVFVATDYTDGPREFWWDELVRLIVGDDASVVRRPALTVSLGQSVLRCPPASGMQVLARTRRWLYRRDPREISGALEQIRVWAGESPVPTQRAEYRPMTREELAKITASGLVQLGAHTRSHPLLAARSLREQADEINGSINDLKDWLGETPTTFAYPFGAPRSDYSRETVKLVEATAVRGALSTRALPVTAASHPYELPRFFVSNHPVDVFERWLTNCFVLRRAPAVRRMARRLARPVRQWGLTVRSSRTDP